MFIRDFEFELLEELSKGKELSQIQNIFNKIINELSEYLNLQPLYTEIKISLIEKDEFKKPDGVSILDFGVNRSFQNNLLILEINKYFTKFLPFILFREAFYSFIPTEVSYPVKICVNQIVENTLITVSNLKEWKAFIRDFLVDKDFIHSEFDKLYKFFKMDAEEPLESAIQFFFKEMRENLTLSQNDNINRFYDIIFERYTYTTSRSLFNLDILETLRILIQIFYENKSYINLTGYLTLFKEFKEKKRSNQN